MPAQQKLSPEELARAQGLYQTGKLSDESLASQLGVSVAYLRRVAKRDGWKRNLTDMIRAEGQDRAHRNEAAELIETRTGREQSPSSLTATAIIEAAATIQAEVRSGHKARLKRMASHADSLMDELDAMQTGGPQLLAKIVEAIEAVDGEAPVYALKPIQDLVETLSAPKRILAFKTLTDAVVKLTDAERNVYDMDKPAENGTSLEDHLEQMNG